MNSLAPSHRASVPFLRRSLAALLVALPSVTCSAPRSGANTIESPHVSGLDVELELVREPELAIRVAVAFEGAAHGETTLMLGEGWGGVRDAGAAAHDLHVTDANGAELAFEALPESRWRVRHAPSAPLRVRYELLANEVRQSSNHIDHYRPIVTPALFHMIGETGIVLPMHMNDAVEREIHFAWKGFDAAEWKVATSFGVDPAGFRLPLAVEKFRHAVFLAGDLGVYSRDVHGRPLYVAIANKGFAFDHSVFVDMAARIVTVEREFFADYDHPYYLISAIPIGVPNPSSLSLGGTGLSQSFATFLLEGTNVAPGTPGYSGLMHLLAHEMFHDWNGEAVSLASPEQRGYWFSEGFTDFYARRILYRAGLIDGAEYARGLSRDLSEYYQSPVIDAPNSRIQAEFWTNSDITKLPYRRGDMVALLVDHELRERSKGERSLDDWMRDLVKRALGGAPPVSTESLLGEIAAMTDDAFAAKIADIVENGATAHLEDTLLAPCLALEWNDTGRFDLGFDFDASMREHKVIAVREASNAYQAGLRDGQVLQAWSVYHGQPAKEVELTILEEGAHQSIIRYLPTGERVAVPRVTWRGDSSDCKEL